MAQLNRRTICTTLVLLGILSTFPSRAHAQRVFVDGGVLADYDPTLRSETATTAGVAGAAGLVLSRRFSVRVEFDLPRWHTSLHAERTVRPQRIEEYEVREHDRAPAVSVLVGYHVRPSSRVEVVLLGGGTRTTRQARLAGHERVLNLDGSLIEHRDAGHRFDDVAWAALTGGAEVALSLGRHLAIVPELRVHGYVSFFGVEPSLIFVRPRIMSRVRF